MCHLEILSFNCADIYERSLRRGVVKFQLSPALNLSIYIFLGFQVQLVLFIQLGINCFVSFCELFIDPEVDEY